MVFSFVGPPTSGKSTISGRLTRDIFCLSHLTIDEFRATTESEQEAWACLVQASANRSQPDLIIETSGLSDELYKLVLPALEEEALVVRFTASLKDIQDRLVERHGAIIPSNVIAWHEYTFASYALPLLLELDTDLDIDTSVLGMEEAYRLALDFLLDRCWLSRSSDQEENGRSSTVPFHSHLHVEKLH